MGFIGGVVFFRYFLRGARNSSFSFLYNQKFLQQKKGMPFQAFPKWVIGSGLEKCLIKLKRSRLPILTCVEQAGGCYFADNSAPICSKVLPLVSGIMKVHHKNCRIIMKAKKPKI